MLTAFQLKKKLYDHARKADRRLPWRETTDPYKILVSEVMLQQTQAERVVPKYVAFIKAFPTFQHLADASLQQLLSAWQGLGYNRRALSLQKAAREIIEKYHGTLPQDPELLVELPGIGPATAASIVVYAFNLPHVFIETNVRAVFIHLFFNDREGITDQELVPLITTMLPKNEARKWYNALMDYGVMLKKQFKNPSRKSAHHTTRSRFSGSTREVRGKIVALLTTHSPRTLAQIKNELKNLPQATPEMVSTLLIQLEKEGFLKKTGTLISVS
jgi:A/G-specific adenine glycosylase